MKIEYIDNDYSKSTFHSVYISTGLGASGMIISSSSTFHSVYISTSSSLVICAIFPDLHSTLFILVHVYMTMQFNNSTSTFHSVYISTSSARFWTDFFNNLHSTLFILVRFVGGYNNRYHCRSTFHSVYISTLLTNSAFWFANTSTFHSVYISTEPETGNRQR